MLHIALIPQNTPIPKHNLLSPLIPVDEAPQSNNCPYHWYWAQLLQIPEELQFPASPQNQAGFTPTHSTAHSYLHLQSSQPSQPSLVHTVHNHCVVLKTTGLGLFVTRQMLLISSVCQMHVWSSPIVPGRNIPSLAK